MYSSTHFIDCCNVLTAGVMAGIDVIADIDVTAGLDVMAGLYVMAGLDGVAADGWLVTAVGLLTSLSKGSGGDEDSAATISDVNTNFNCFSMPLVLFRISSNR